MSMNEVHATRFWRVVVTFAGVILLAGPAFLAASQTPDPPSGAIGTNGPPVIDLDQDLGPAPQDTSSGFDFAVHALFGNAREVEYNTTTKHAYLGCDHTFVVVSMADGAHPSLVGYLNLDTTGQLGISGMVYPGSGNYVYLVTENLLIVVDVSTSSSPHVEGQVTLPGGNTAEGLYVSGSSAYVPMYVAGNTGIFYMVNVATPSAPTILGSKTTPYPAYSISAVVKGANTFAYVGCDLSTSHYIYVFNVTNPASIPAATTSFAALAKPWDIVVSGLYAYVAMDTSDLRILNAPDDGSLSSLTSLAISGTVTALSLVGTNLYVCGGTGGLSVVDVTTPGSPVLGATFDSPGTAADVAVSGSSVFLADTTSSVLLSGAPTTLTSTSRFLTPRAYGVYASDRYAYWASGDEGLVIEDLTNIARPSIVGSLSMLSAVDVTVVGSRAYLATSSYGIRVVDVGNPAVPTLLGSYDTLNAYALKVVGNFAYVADGTAGLVILDVSNPASIHVEGTYNTTGEARDVDIQGNIAYVADYGGGLTLLDISNPASPTFLSNYVFPGGASGSALRVEVARNSAYVSTYTNGFFVMDVANPYNPVLLGSAGSGAHHDAVVSGDYLFEFYYSGIAIEDISSPASISMVGSFTNSDYGAQRGFLRGGYLFGAFGSGGAYILHPTVLPYDPYEVNDFFDQAYPITPSSFYRSKISWSDDMDFYSLSLASCGSIQADMNPPAAEDYDLYLYDSSRNLVGYSVHSGDATESITKSSAAAGTYYLVVVGQDGSQYSTSLYYSLAFSTTTSPVPLLAVLISNVTYNAQNYAVLHVQDPNQPSAVSGYDIYRSDAPAGPFTLWAQNVADMDSGTPNVQYVDQGSNGPDHYYRVVAYNAPCDTEGP
jgi:hypothetical protein